MRRETVRSSCCVGDWFPIGRRKFVPALASSMRGPRPSTKNRLSALPSVRVGAWCRRTVGSSGSGPGASSNPTISVLPSDRPCLLPHCGSAGRRVGKFWNRSLLLPPTPRPGWPTFTIGNRLSSIRTISMSGSTRHRRRPDCSNWHVGPMPGPSGNGPSVPGLTTSATMIRISWPPEKGANEELRIRNWGEGVTTKGTKDTKGP